MRRFTILMCAACLLAGMQSKTLAQRKGFSDQAVQQAMEKGVGHLWTGQRADGSWPPIGSPAAKGNYFPAGPTAMAVYALLECGVSPQEPRMTRSLKWLAEQDSHMTYTLGLRANAYLAAIRKGADYGPHLRRDVMRLVKSTADGSYTYESKGDGKSSGDNSNSQYGLLGAWAGALGNMEIPKKYWYMVMKHWINCQNGDGGWCYRKGSPSTHTMTAAGVASLFVCFDNLFSEEFIKCNVATEFAPIQRGLDWFHRNFDKPTRGGRYPYNPYYYLYGIERVGLASGYKYFGTSDWYKLGAADLIRRQGGGGGWGTGVHGVVNTSFALLFLARGRHPVLFNKLEFDGDWNNRPRDMANLTRWISRTFETTINWQIINLRVPVREWHDAPILYISGSKAPNFTDEHIDKLRRFVWQGGTIFSVTECGGSGFRTAIRELYAKLFPKYELVPCSKDHDLYSVYFKLAGKPKFYVVSNGVRALAIHTDEDLSRRWQQWKSATAKWAFDAAANVFMYVTDKGGLRPRGTNLWPEEPTKAAKRTIKLARLKYAGNYDPEPLAWERFSRLMAGSAGTGIELLGPMDISKLADSGAKIAAMTGTGSFTLTQEQKQALKQFTAGGGTLVIDCAGGPGNRFAKSAEQMLKEVYGARALKTLPAASPLYTLAGVATNMDITAVKYRRATKKRLGAQKRPNLRAVFIEDRPAVIYSREDITAALVGYLAYTCDGYDPGGAREPGSGFRVMRNIILYANQTPRPRRHRQQSRLTKPLNRSRRSNRPVNRAALRQPLVHEKACRGRRQSAAPPPQAKLPAHRTEMPCV